MNSKLETCNLWGFFHAPLVYPRRNLSLTFNYMYELYRKERGKRVWMKVGFFLRGQRKFGQTKFPEREIMLAL